MLNAQTTVQYFLEVGKSIEDSDLLVGQYGSVSEPNYLQRVANYFLEIIHEIGQDQTQKPWLLVVIAIIAYKLQLDLSQTTFGDYSAKLVDIFRRNSSIESEQNDRQFYKIFERCYNYEKFEDITINLASNLVQSNSSNSQRPQAQNISKKSENTPKNPFSSESEDEK